MNRDSQTFWTVLSISATAIGSMFFMLYAHAIEPKHPEAAHESTVRTLEIRFERIATDVENNKMVLAEVKTDVKELRVEQRAATEQILRAIRDE